MTEEKVNRWESLKKLGVQELEMLKFMARYQRDSQGRPPSFREIMGACGYGSVSTVKYKLEILESYGLLENTAGRIDTKRQQEDTSRSYVIAASVWQRPSWFDMVDDVVFLEEE